MHEKSYTALVIAIVVIVGFGAVFLLNGSPRDSMSTVGYATQNPKTSNDAVSSGKGSSFQVNGPHYNLNIIGAKTVGDIGNSMGHTLFVQLNGKTKIIMTQAADGQFVVTDRNGLDGSASFNIAPGKYNIYARGLGKPGGSTKIDAYGEFTDALDGTQLVLLGYVNIERTKGTPKNVNINNLFYVDVTLCLEVNLETGACYKEGVYTDYWVFDIEELLNYWWEYDNQGLKLLQVRFYPCTLDPSGTASDYCRWGDGTAINSQKTILAS